MDWNKTKLREFLSHEKCQQSEACHALAGFQYAKDPVLQTNLMKLWIKHNLMNNLSYQSTEEFIDLAIVNGLPPPWLEFAISNGLYKQKKHIKIPTPFPTDPKINTKPMKRRRDLLTPIIEEAVKEAGSYDSAKVFLILKEKALSSTSPFTGNIEGDSLQYTNSKNKIDLLSKEAIGKRLSRLHSKC